MLLCAARGRMHGHGKGDTDPLPTCLASRAISSAPCRAFPVRSPACFVLNARRRGGRPAGPALPVVAPPHRVSPGKFHFLQDSSWSACIMPVVFVHTINNKTKHACPIVSVYAQYNNQKAQGWMSARPARGRSANRSGTILRSPGKTTSTHR